MESAYFWLIIVVIVHIIASAVGGGRTARNQKFRPSKLPTYYIVSEAA